MKRLKNYHIEMWNLVQEQVEKAFVALLSKDEGIAREIIARERLVNAQELVVDHHCEDFIALFAPVAVDLRFVISIIKITNNLERIGDFAKSIAKFVLNDQSKPIDAELMADLNMEKMFETIKSMLSMARMSLIKEDSSICREILRMDDEIDVYNKTATKIICQHIQSNPEETYEMLQMDALIRRIERIGDRTSNIAEEIVFFLDAKELRHQK